MSPRNCGAFLFLLTGTVSGAQGIDALGSQLSELDRGLFTCAGTSVNTQCQARGKPLEHLGLPVLGVTLEYRSELLNRTTVLFDEPRFAQIEGSLTARFGAPEIHDEQLRSGMAGAFVNRVRVWRRDGNVAMLDVTWVLIWSAVITAIAVPISMRLYYRER